MTTQNVYSGMAALSICESLLLALNDREMLPEKEILGILNDAANSHEEAVGTDDEADAHRGVAALIRKIIAGGNSVRRP